MFTISFQGIVSFSFTTFFSFPAFFLFKCVFMYVWLQLANTQHFQCLLMALTARKSETGTQQEKHGCHQWLPLLAQWKRE